MDEVNLLLPPGLETALDEYYLTPTPRPGFAARLEAQLRQRQVETTALPKPRKVWLAARRTLRARPVLALVAAILAILAITGAVYALGRLTGFIPGFGFTSDANQVSVLAEPALVTSVGVSLQVDQAVNDSSCFWVTLTVSGLSGQPRSFPASLILPDGQEIQYQEAGGSGSSQEGEGFTLSYTFPPIPGKPGHLTLSVQGLAGQDFTVPIELRPIRANEIIPEPPTSEQQLRSQDHDGISLVLDHIAQDPDKTIFQVSLEFDQDNLMTAAPWDISLTGVDGKIYPLTEITPDTLAYTGKTHVYQTVPLTGDEQLTLTLTSFPFTDSLPAMIDFSDQGAKTALDLGANPQIGDTWALDQPIDTAGYALSLVGVSLIEGPSLILTVRASDPVTGVMFNSPDPIVTGASGGGQKDSGLISTTINLAQIPDHPFDLRVMNLYFTASGPWTIQWQPMASPTLSPGMPTASPTDTRLSPTATPTMDTSSPTYLEVQQLTDRFNQTLRQGPGWVHMVEEAIHRTDPNRVYPPDYLKSEDWYQIDEQGYILNSVHSDFGEGGQLLQQGVTVGNYSANLLTGQASTSDSPPYRISNPGADLSAQALSAAVDNGDTVSQEDALCENGNPCLLVTLVEQFPEPIQNPGESAEFFGFEEKFWMDKTSGMLYQRQVAWLLPDGSRLLDGTFTYILVEKVDSAPQEVLDILAGVVIP